MRVGYCECNDREKRNGGNCRIKTPLDWFMEAVLYGGGGGLLGLGLALVIMSQSRGLMIAGRGWIVLAGFTLTGLLAGLLGGERGIRWIGQKIRDRESR